jgi:hypothetical protein
LHKTLETHRSRILTALLFLSLLLAGSKSALFAQVHLLEPEEAPEAIFDFNIGDKEVELFLLGSWSALLSGATGFMVRPDVGVTSLDYFPDLELGFLFEQVPDITLSVWLMKRYFLELSVLGSFENNYILMGYQGREDELVHHVYLGNRDINIDPYPFIEIPEMGESSLGGEAELGTPSSVHQMMIRFDNNDTGGKLFIGQNEVEEQVISLDSYLKGQYFKLPDDDVDNLEVYLEDADGSFSGDDQRKYRKADLDDGILDSSEGLLSLNEQHTGRVLVYYTKDGSPVGSVGLGIGSIAWVDNKGSIYPETPDDFDWTKNIDYLGDTWGNKRKVTIAGKDSLLLWEPGMFSEFDVSSSYTLPAGAPLDLWRIRISGVKKGSKEKSTDHDVLFQAKPGENRFEAYIDDDLRANLANLYPFLRTPFVIPPDNRLYGPFSDELEGNYDREILLQILHPISAYYLEPNVIPGSVQVLRNGKEETRFGVDYETGALSFDITINPTDRIEVSYKKRGALLNNGDLVFGWGNKFQLNDYTNLEVATGFRWNFLPGSYSEKAYSRTGAVLGSTRLKAQYDYLSYDVSAGISYTHPDTTGILRLLTMEETGLEVNLSEDLAYPSSAAKDDIAPFLPFSFDQINRGKLLYKDYRKYGLLGEAVLQGPDWDPPSEQIFAYETGSQPGPYNVADGSSDDIDQSLVLEFELQSNEWVGVQMPVLPGMGISDLSTLKAILLSYKMIDFSGSGDIDMYVQIGEIDEDLDGDDEPDEETSPSSSGFLFNEGNFGYTLLVGGGPKLEGNFRLDSEDVDGNEFLDSEVEDNVLTAEGGPIITNISSNISWSKVKSYFVTDQQKAKLKRTRVVRLMLANDSLSSCSGRLLIDQLTLAGTIFGIKENNSVAGTVESREIRESTSKIPPPEKLEDAYPEVQDTFHAFGEIQKVLEVDWSGYASGESWTIQGFPQNGSEGIRYRELVYYMRTPDLSVNKIITDTQKITFSFLDPDGRGVTWSFEPPDCNAWKKITVDLDEEKVLWGKRSIAANVSVSSKYGNLSRFVVKMQGYSAGTIYLDELHLKEPEGAFGGALAAETTMSWPGINLSISDVPFISDLTVKEKMHVISPGFSPLYGKPGVSWDTYSETSVAFGLFFTQLEMELEVLGIDDAFWMSGGHRLDVPRGQSVIHFSDVYFLRDREEGAEFNRRNSIDLTVAELGHVGVESEAFTQESLLTQIWEGSVSVPPPEWSDMSFRTEFSKTTTDYEHREMNYFSSWILGYRYLAPRFEEEDLERSANSSLGVGLLPAPVGFEIATSTSYRSTDITSSQRDQFNSLSYELSLPITLSRELGLTLTPGYTRMWEGTCEESEPGSVMRDYGTMFYRFSTQPYLFDQPPIKEFYSKDTEEKFIHYASDLDKAVYHPKALLGLARRIPSHWTSLVLPSQVDFAFGRSFEKSGDLYKFLNSYDFSYRTNAINLFGQFGAYPAFSFYTVDEYSTGFTMSLLYNEYGKREKASYRIEQFLSFEGWGGNLFTLTNYTTIDQEKVENPDITTDTKIGYNWFIYPKGGIPLPLISREIAKTGFISHEESLSLVFHNLNEQTTVHPVTLLASHETALRFPDHGYLRGLLGIGFDLESYPIQDDRENIYRYGFLALIEAKIEF